MPWLASQHPGEIRPLLELGDAQRQATAALDAGWLRELSRQQRELVAALLLLARDLADAAGQAFSDSTARGLEDTLHAGRTQRQLQEKADCAARQARRRLSSRLVATSRRTSPVAANASRPARFRSPCARSMLQSRPDERCCLIAQPCAG